jgi:sortase A
MRITRLVGVLIAASLAVSLIGAPAVGESSSRRDHATPNPSRQRATHPSQSNGALLGTLRIPAIALEEPVTSGVAPQTIDRGVAHWVGTARAGDDGNVVLAGHRTTHTRPFYDLDQLDYGDLVYMTDRRGREVMYRVTDTFIVRPRDVWITYDQGRPMLTMFACHPKGSNRLRIVVQAELVGGHPIA